MVKEGNERGKEAGSYRGDCYHEDDAADDRGGKKAAGYRRRGEHKADHRDDMSQRTNK